MVTIRKSLPKLKGNVTDKFRKVAHSPSNITFWVVQKWLGWVISKIPSTLGR